VGVGDERRRSVEAVVSNRFEEVLEGEEGVGHYSVVADRRVKSAGIRALAVFR